MTVQVVGSPDNLPEADGACTCWSRCAEEQVTAATVAADKENRAKIGAEAAAAAAAATYAPTRQLAATQWSCVQTKRVRSTPVAVADVTA